MKKKLLYLLYSLLFFLPATALAQTANHVVISEMFGGGGNGTGATAAPYANDFIELYNPTSADINIGGWSVQYASAAGTSVSATPGAGVTPIPTGAIIRAHGYFLIEESIGANTAAAALPTPDVIGTIAISGTAGKVYLVNNSTVLASVAYNAPGVVDMLGFGTTATPFEGTGPAPAPSNTTSVERKASATSTSTTMAAGGTEDLKGNGWDSDNNANDFFVPTTINPQNSASPIEPAIATTTPVLSATPTTLDFGTTQFVGTTSAAKSFSLSETNVPASGASLSVVAPYSISSSATGTFGTSLSFTQAQLATAQPVYVEFSPTAAGAAPVSINVTSTGAAAFTVPLTGTAISASTPVLSATPTTLDFGTTQAAGTTSAAQIFSLSETNVPASGASLSVAAPYSISSSATGPFSTTLSFTQAQLANPQPVYVEFSPTATGAAPVSINVTSTGASALLIPLTGTATAATGIANHVVISQIYGAGGNSGATYTNDFVELYNPTSTAVVMTGWSLQYQSAGGVSTFSGVMPFPDGATVKPHGYYLVQLAGGTTGAPLPVTADYIPLSTNTVTSFNMSGTSGKVALCNSVTQLSGTPVTTAATPPPLLVTTSIVDFVSYGLTNYNSGFTIVNPTTPATASTTPAAPLLTPTGTDLRIAKATSTAATMAPGGADVTAGNGYDSGVNSTDFVLETAPNITVHNSATAAAPVIPTLTAAPATLTFSQTISTTSTAQSFTLSGTSLTAGASLTVAAPYSISTSATGTYGSTLTFTQAQLATAQTVYVQFAPTAVGTANGFVIIASTGVTSQTVTLNGTGTAPLAPVLTVTPPTLTFTQSMGTPSAAQTISVSATNVPTTGVTVTTAAPYAVSATATGTYGTTLTLTQAQLATAQTVYVQFTPTVVGAGNGTITVASVNAVSQTVTLNGTGLTPPNVAPTLNAVTDQTVCYTSVPQNIALSNITPGPEATQSVVVSVTSNNAALFAQLGVFTISGTTTGTLSYTIANNASGTAVVTVKVQDNGGTANGGVDTYTRTFNITVNALPTAGITSDIGNTITLGSTAHLTAAAGATTYAWTGTDIISGQATAIVIVRPRATTTYTLVETNAAGCTTTQTFIVTVNTFKPLVTNNILTPDGDGKNDTWIVQNIDYYPTSFVKVVDKAGKVVFSKTNYLNDWDGTYNGQPLTQGTYYYVIDLGTGAPKYTGYITLIRK